MHTELNNPEIRNVRIIVQQPALPKYRIAFFKSLMSRPGIELKVYYSSADASLRISNVDGLDAEDVPMWTRAIGARRIMWHAAQWMGARRGACDILVLSWDAQYLSLVPSLLWAKVNGIRTILWGHGFSKQESVIRKFIRNSIGRLANALVFYDHATAARFVAEGWKREKIHVAPNTLDQKAIQRERDNWKTDSERLNSFQISEGLFGKKNIIYIGRIYPENRLDLLVEALPDILKTHPEVQLLVIGTANETTKKIQEQAEVIGVEGSIKWLGAIYEEEEIAPYMLSSVLFCYPENIGLSIMHAMGYGIPVLTGDHIPSHNPEIHVLKNGVNGVLFKQLNSADLAVTVSSLMDRPEHLEKLGEAARETIMESFTTEKMVDGFLGAINAVTKKSV